MAEITKRGLSFSIQGPFITNLAREKFKEGKLESALNTLISCLQSLIVYKDKIYRVKPKVQKKLRKYNVIRLASYEKYHEKEDWDINDFPKRVVYGRRPRMRYTPKKIWSRYPVFNVSIVELEREEQNFKEGNV
mgnify:CR=1 FL=1